MKQVKHTAPVGRDRRARRTKKPSACHSERSEESLNALTKTKEYRELLASTSGLIRDTQAVGILLKRKPARRQRK